jgi:hypothetical protein
MEAGTDGPALRVPAAGRVGAVSPEPIEDGLAVVHTATEGARFLACASVVDILTQDPVFRWAE